MSLPLKHSLSIEMQKNPETGEQFGSKYGGEFIIRRPTLADKRDIALRDAASLNIYGQVNPLQMDRDVVNVNYIFANMDVIAEKRPEWFDMGKLYDGADEAAVYAVWTEVSRWLDTFRPDNNSGAGGDGSPAPQVLV